MNIAKLLAKIRFLPDWLLIRLYPPFLLMGVRISSVSPDYHHLEAVLPLRWWARNINGTLFGGFMCAATDPMAALMCHRIFPGAQIWTKNHSVEFLKPAKSRLLICVNIPKEQVAEIRRLLDTEGQCTQTFEFQMVDSRYRVVARVSNTLFIRRGEGRKLGVVGEPL
ncbi:MAG TPA: DUF4442 domain-containing protein [Bdellovibrionota bacterium]|nr:DUF4442 domain-containing protein [Bdellovibrionota bacterium]